MDKESPSKTAALAAVLRAAHLLLDDEPWILQDDFAAPMLGVENGPSVLAMLRSFQDELAGALTPDLADSFLRSERALVTLRARYVEDELAKAVARGVSQYVILGSGFDSFAYRRPDLMRSLRVYEVDHPSTQQRKLARLRELQIDIPRNVTFVSIDFETQQIPEQLEMAGFRRDQAAFFSWLAVVVYLTDTAISRTLRQIASTASGSEIIFDYLVPDNHLGDEERHIVATVKILVAQRGEPVHSCFEPARLKERMREFGFASAENLDPDEANARYLSRRTDGLRLPQRTHLMRAQVGG